MKRNLITICMLLIASLSAWSQVSDASFDATILAKQSMTDNASPTSLVNWTVSKDGTTLENNQAPIASHVTTLNIDASAISGTISSVSVFANSKVDIAGELLFNGTTATMPKDRATSVYHSSGTDGSGGTCDVVTVDGSATTCKAYLLPVALTGGVRVTVKTTDGKYYTQNFSEDIAASATKTLTITSTTAGQLWMSTIPGNVYFSMLSTPGAHDAATSGVTSYTSASKCQDMTIQQLLDAGVRCFDFRPGYYYNTTITESNLYIYHGQVSTNVLYKDAMATLADFVKNNPTEAITITMVKENCCPTINIINKWTDRSSEMWTVIDAIQETYKDYMKTLDHSYYTLDDFRGKICYINRTGTKASYTTQITNWPDDGSILEYSSKIGDVCYANIQDGYNRNGTTKQDSIKIMLGYSSSNSKSARFHFNFCSSANSPASYASATNPVITTYLNGNNISGPTGYLYGDYMGSSSNGGAALLTAIINQNYKYVYNGTPTITPLYDADAENMDLSQGHSVAWTTTGTWTDAYGDATTKTYVTENYSGWNAQTQTGFSLTRDVYLPAGTYKLTGYGMYNGTVGSAKLIAKNGSNIFGSINILAGTLDSSDSGLIADGVSSDLRKAANAFAKGISLNTVYFVLTEPTSVTIGFEGTHTAYRQWFVAGPVTLEKIDEIVASDDSPVDVTSFIDNPTIYNTTQSACPSGWTEYARVAGNGNYTTGTGDTQIENWHGTPSSGRFDYYQTLTLPAGKYTLGADLLYRNGGADEVGIYAYDVTTGARVTAAAETIDASLHTVSLEFYTSGGDVNIGIINLKTMTGDWFAADNFTLTYYGAESISRATAEGKYGTICLPYTATATGATAYSATISGSTVELTEVGTTLEAGTPYIYKATDSSQSFTFGFGGKVTTPTASGPLVGSFTKQEVPSDGTAYLLQTQSGIQAFYKVSSEGLYVGKYKAYLYNNSAYAAAKLSIGLDTEDDEVSTAIDALNALTNGTARIYDTQGRQRTSLQKGINIINGCKVVVR